MRRIIGSSVLNNIDSSVVKQMSFEDIEGYFDENCGCKLYDDVVNKLPNNSNIVEIGCYLGRSTFYLIENLKKRDISFNLDVVDVFQNIFSTDNKSNYKESYLEDFCKNLGSNLKYINIINKNYSTKASEYYKNNTLDFIYIDASHREEDVINDIKLWYPKLKEGGIMGGDDWQKPGVRSAVIKSFLLNTTEECHPYQQKWSIYKYKSFELKYNNQWIITK